MARKRVMTEREKYLFDLQGFLIIRDFLTNDEVATLNEAVDANIEKQSDDDNSVTGDSKSLVGQFKRGALGGMLTWPQPWCTPFREMLTHKKAIPYLNEIHGRGWRMDHSPFILTSKTGAEGLLLHGSTAHHFDGSQYYTFANDQMRCGMVVFEYQLYDQNEGDGGFCAIAGSHKANLRAPQELLEWDFDRDVVSCPEMKAGDLMIFNEATTHGNLPWTSKNDRRALLYRYSPKYLHFAGGEYQPVMPEWTKELTDAQRAVLEPPYIYNRPLIEDDGVTVVNPRRE